MKYYTYSRQYVDGKFDDPTGYLPVNSTSSIFYVANWFGAAEIDSLDVIYSFDPTEISKEYFDEAFAAQPVPPPSGSI